MDFRSAHSHAWIDYFTRIGYPAAQPLAAGVEGAVYRLGDGHFAWCARQLTAPQVARSLQL